MTQRIHLFITGRVQGVFYRQTTEDMARQLGLRGWVRNLPDGRVETVAEGPAAALSAFSEYCHEGPPMARVTHVEVLHEEPTGEFGQFETRR